MWFLVVAAFAHGAEQRQITAGMAIPRYSSHAACMVDARPRATALASVGLHGRYLCMRNGEPDRLLAVTEKREF